VAEPTRDVKIFGWIIILRGVLSAAIGVLGLVYYSQMKVPIVLSAALLLIGTLSLVAGWEFLKLKPWARTLAIVLQLVFIAEYIFYMAKGFDAKLVASKFPVLSLLILVCLNMERIKKQFKTDLNA
jgi:hypothetical protein